jgi:hypothetical protein
MRRGVAVFSGISTKVLNDARATLRSMAIESAFVGFDRADSDYFARLMVRTTTIVSRLESGGASQIHLLLFSGLEGSDLGIEEYHFCPALRRVGVPRAWRKDRQRASELTTLVKDTFRDDGVWAFAKEVRSQRALHLLLPIRNSKVRPLANVYADIYRGCRTEVSQRVKRSAMLRKRGQGIRIGNVDLCPVVNADRHPVRRISDTPLCDFNARFRFGSPIPTRFEFDVTCESGIAGKTFYQCDGHGLTVSKSATHLNMRVNDDFAEA